MDARGAPKVASSYYYSGDLHSHIRQNVFRVYSGVQILHTGFAQPVEHETVRRDGAAGNDSHPLYTGFRIPLFPIKMLKTAVVIHYHELWLKGRNRKFFLGKFVLALRRAFADFPSARMRQPGDRVVLEFGLDTPVETIIGRLERVLGIAYFAVARSAQRGSGNDLDALCQLAW